MIAMAPEWRIFQLTIQLLKMLCLQPCNCRLCIKVIFIRPIDAVNVDMQLSAAVLASTHLFADINFLSI